VEYLTSDEAGEPLEGKFAWPVPWIVNGAAGLALKTATLPKAVGRERRPLLTKVVAVD
jgi:hypothetical protein